MIGITKAAVFPVPVWAMANTSSPFKIGGIALNWISVGFLNPSLEMLVFIPSAMRYSSNFIKRNYVAKIGFIVKLITLLKLHKI